MPPLFYGVWRMRWSNDVIFGVFKADTILPLLSAIVTADTKLTHLPEFY